MSHRNKTDYAVHNDEKISGFSGTYEFLSNFYHSPITLDGITYLNGEAAFQAQKSKDDDIKRRFCNLNALEAKRLGRKIDLRKDWETIAPGETVDTKTKEMERVSFAKYDQNPDLETRLLETDGKRLIEKNHWYDRCWGTDLQEKGENRLGKLLEKTRDRAKARKEKETSNA